MLTGLDLVVSHFPDRLHEASDLWNGHDDSGFIINQPLCSGSSFTFTTNLHVVVAKGLDSVVEKEFRDLNIVKWQRLEERCCALLILQHGCMKGCARETACDRCK